MNHLKDPSPPDVSARIARLFVYPIKSCAGIELAEARLQATGIEHDRAFMLVDAAGEFVSQRELPRMALIRPRFEGDALVVSAPGKEPLCVPLAAGGAKVQVRVWDDSASAFDLGDAAARWFSGFLADCAPPSLKVLRLVRFDASAQRLSSRRLTGEIPAPIQFADGFAMLALSQASLDGLNDRLASGGHAAVGIERFRPSLVLDHIEAHDEDRLDVLRIDADGGTVQLKTVKPCIRCPIPNIDPATAESDPAVSDALQAYRRDDAMNGAVTFGMNAVVLAGAGGRLRVGQTVSANWRFD